MKLTKVLATGMMLVLAGCAHASPVKPAKTEKVSSSAGKCGGASWYSLHGNRTASGERMNANGMTAAHRSLKHGTRIRVTNQRNGKSVTVRINDRGPFIKGRILDLSKGSAGKIGMLSSGVGSVCYKIIK